MIDFRIVVRYFRIVLACAAVLAVMAAKQRHFSVPSGARLYLAPMEWNLDCYIAAEIRSQGLPVEVVADPKAADFVMTSFYQSLGSHLMAPGHFVRVSILSADSGSAVWSTEADDYAAFFGRMRSHGPSRVAKTVIRKLNRRMAAQVTQSTGRR